MGFPKVIGLAVILYSYSIKDFLSSWSINSFPWSWVFSIGLGYLESHVVSTKFAIYMALLSLYCAISNHHIIGSIIVTHFKSEFYLLPFLPMIQGTIISTQVLFHNFPQLNYLVVHHIFYLIVLNVDKCHNWLLPSGRKV